MNKSKIADLCQHFLGCTQTRATLCARPGVRSLGGWKFCEEHAKEQEEEDNRRAGRLLYGQAHPETNLPWEVE